MNALIQQLRIHQWVKNLLLFVPIGLAHKLDDTSSLISVVFSFVAFSLSASAVYIVNDILDVNSDKEHPNKRHRPIASGALSVVVALGTAISLITASIVIAFVWTNQNFLQYLFAYIVVASAYSAWLKRFMLIDVFVLAAFYVLRIEAGAQAANVVVSPWLLAFSLFIFTSLAFLKRYTELRLTIEHEGRVFGGRGYHVGDADFIIILGPIVGLLAVLIFTLYLNGQDVQILYHNPLRLWFAVPLVMYWVCYMWLCSHRGRMHDDPILFALKDKVSYAVAALTISVIVWAR